MALGAIETATAALELAKGVYGVAKGSRSNQRLARPVVRALREIYFTPRGTLRILAVLADGGIPDPDDLQDILIDFNDHQWRVERHLDVIDFERSDGRGLSLRQRRTLTEIAYGKRNLRRELQECFNVPNPGTRPIEPRQAKKLLEQVMALNTCIEQLEEELL